MISHHHSTIFVHVPKCGGQSVEDAFLRDLGLSWEQRAPLLLHSNDQPRIGPRRLAHLTAHEYVKYRYATAEHFDTYYKFATVRDPVERFVSFFNYQGPKIRKRSFVKASLGGADADTAGLLDKYLQDTERALTDPAQKVFGSDDFFSGDFWFLRPQSDFLFNEGNCLVDDIIVLRDLNDKWSRIQERASLPSSLKNRNTSVKRITSKDLSVTHVAKIKELYDVDYALIDFKASRLGD